MFVAKGTSWPLTDEGLGGPTLQAHLERDGRTVTMRLPRPRDAGRAWSALSTWGPRLRLDEAAAAASGLVEAPVAGGDPPSPFEARFGARARAFLRGGVEGEDGGTPLELRRARSDQPERYHLMKPEAHLIRTETALRRTGGQTEVSIHVDGVTGQLSLAAPGGSPLRYARFDHLTHSLGRAVFAAGGQYLFAYDDQSYLVVRPTTRLGWGEFGEYDLLNFYSRDPARVARASEDELVEWLRARWLEAREAAQR